MSEEQTVEIAEARGRPMLHWVGKRPLSYVTAFPAQTVERFDPTEEQSEAQGLLFHGDNKDVLAWLLAHGYRGKVDLVYIDPPFDSGADYVRKVQLRGIRKATKLEGDAHSLGEQVQYTDIWANDNYLQFMYERLIMLKELLSERGSIYVHCDQRKSHHLRCIMDEIFGAECLCNHIIWSYRRWPSTSDKYQSMHDDILFYCKNPKSDRVFHIEYEDPSESYLKRFKGKTQILDEETGTRKITIDEETKGLPMRDVWNVSILAGYKAERTSFPTQKPEELIQRIMWTSSNTGDLVLDCFVGSGTTAAVAQKLGRRWIASDINKGAVQTTSKRLQTIIREQIEAGAEPRQATMEFTKDDEGSPPPAALSFSVYRVNDYDLQIQHNEAVNLAVEHVGIERTKTDVYFDGTLGKRLVKIVPFNHPLTLLDLQLLQDELKTRLDEDRDIVLVCLGKETAVDAWLEDYNRHRPVNRIDVIELRTDQKYGKFFVHQPAQAQVNISRQDDKIVVEIEDFISPTIVERLEMDTPLFKAKIPDWRAMVDVVMIDTAYDGEVFDITLSDVPERKDDLVVGRYELPAPPGETTVAIKIIDMLGEEVLVVENV